MRVYIAGPMTGIVHHNYPAFERAAQNILLTGNGPLSPTTVDDGQRHPWAWYMRRTLALLLTADEVVLLPGWRSSIGASLEHDVATRLEIPVGPLDEWLDAHGGTP